MKRLLSKIQKQQFQLLSNLKLDDGDDDYYNDTPVIYVSYSRPEVVDPEIADDSELTDEIRLRLAIATSKALKKYQEVWG